jgi:hypothetical protein
MVLMSWCYITEGVWNNNKKHGFGKDYNAAGELLYEGEWTYDKPASNGSASPT